MGVGCDRRLIGVCYFREGRLQYKAADGKRGNAEDECEGIDSQEDLAICWENMNPSIDDIIDLVESGSWNGRRELSAV